MRKLARSEKLEAYTYALLISYEARDMKLFAPICPILRRWLDVEKNIDLNTNDAALPYFKEFLKQKPHKVKSLWMRWWGEKEYLSRIKAIERAIALTEKLKK